jgi:hypothetical protein
MARIGRKPTSNLPARYWEQAEVRKTLNDYALASDSLQAAADKLGCTYRELSNYRHGIRWIPDNIVKKLGFDSKSYRRVMRVGQSNHVRGIEKAIRTSNVVRAAAKFAETFRNDRLLDRRLQYRAELFTAVEMYRNLGIKGIPHVR